MKNEDLNKSNQQQRNPRGGVRNEADGSFSSNEDVDFGELPHELQQAIEARPELSRSDFCSPELLSWLASDSGNLKVLLSEVLTGNMDVNGMLKRNAESRRKIQEPDFKAIGLAEDFFDCLKNRISANLIESEEDAEVTSSDFSGSVDLQTEVLSDSGKEDYRFLFEQSDGFAEFGSANGEQSNDKAVSVQSKDSSETTASGIRQNRKNQNRNSQKHRWGLTLAASLLIVALSVAAYVVMRPQPVTPVAIVTVETVCNESLSWNPNRVLGDWSFEDAPVDRAYPSHLMKYRAQGWKKMALPFDDKAVVYNLIPDDDLSQQKAYLYVFSPAEESFELPQEFRLSPNANLNYRRWSLACQQQDLVYVLVYDSDQADRVLNLVKVQDVG